MIFGLTILILDALIGIYLLEQARKYDDKLFLALGVLCIAMFFQSMMFMLVYIVDQYRIFGRLI